MMRRRLVAGNWKMNGGPASEAELAALRAAHPTPRAEILVCPPATLIAQFRKHDVPLGGQDCHPEPDGAHTGDIAAEMLRDAGAGAVIVGHSERRADHGEDDALVAAKVRAAWRAGLIAIVCVGETEAQRDAGEAVDVVRGQLQGSLPGGATASTLVVAYEPVWAIGTGRTPTLEEIGAMHASIRATLRAVVGPDEAEGIRILYGGSVKPGNAAEIFAVPDVDGALVGGASLKAADFGAIVAAAET
jgi:triosephosphate isomerase (TIM)